MNIDFLILSDIFNSKVAYLFYGAIFTAVVKHFFDRKIQKDVWLRDFDRFECEQLIQVFEKILISVDHGDRIEEATIDTLNARTILLRYLDISTKEKITTLKKLCFEHREAIEKTKKSTSGTAQEETHCKHEIQKSITEIIDNMRKLFVK
jgi:hypothetical protein